MNRSDLIAITNKLTQLVKKCVSGELSFNEFLVKYGNPIGEYALDGHESNLEEKEMLKNNTDLIKLHVEITESILHPLCSSEQAKDPLYVENGRIGPEVAFKLLKEIASRHEV